MHAVLVQLQVDPGGSLLRGRVPWLPEGHRISVLRRHQVVPVRAAQELPAVRSAQVLNEWDVVIGFRNKRREKPKTSDESGLERDEVRSSRGLVVRIDGLWGIDRIDWLRSRGRMLSDYVSGATPLPQCLPVCGCPEQRRWSLSGTGTSQWGSFCTFASTVLDFSAFQPHQSG